MPWVGPAKDVRCAVQETTQGSTHSWLSARKRRESMRLSRVRREKHGKGADGATSLYELRHRPDSAASNSLALL